MSYKVFKVRYELGMQDPDMPGTRYHTVIFVETNAADGSGVVHNVEGDIVKGMAYVARNTLRPEVEENFHNKELLGTILESNHPTAMDRICEAQPPPGPQKKYNAKTNRTEPVKPDGTFYEPGESRLPLIKCTEWTQDQVIPALQAAGILTT